MEKRYAKKNKRDRIVSLLLAFFLIFSFLPLTVGSFPSQAKAGSFTEDFSTANYKDSANTTADWNTALGKLRLPQSATTGNWTKADGVTPGYDNVSNNSGTSNTMQFVLDSSSRPNIVWEDDTLGNLDIFFSRWNGSSWTKANGTTPGYDNVSSNSGNSWQPQIALDSSNRPNIVWDDITTGSVDIFFSRWNGSAWTKANGVTPGYDNISNNIGNSWEPQIALDSSNRPNIVWHDYTNGNGDIFFSRWNGSSWTKADGTTSGYENISNNSGKSWKPQVVLDSSFRPNIVWEDETTGNCDIFFSKWNGTSWTKANGTTTGYDNVSNNSGTSNGAQIIFDDYYYPNIVWQDFTPGNQDIFFSRWNGSAWTKADGSTSGYDNLSNNSGDSKGPKIALDTSGRANIVWRDTAAGNADIFFSRWNGSFWTKADGTTSGYDNLSNNSGWSTEPQIAIDTSGRANIVWQDFTPGNQDIFFSRWNGSAWTKANGVTPGYDNISNNPGLSLIPLIVLDTSGKPNIVWNDSTTGNYDIFFSKYTAISDFISPKQAQSIKINVGSQNITKATLTANQNLNGQTVNYYLSVNGGVNWESVTPGVEYTFVNQGNDLRWKASLSTTNPSVTPEIDSLTINYTEANVVTDSQKPTGSISIEGGALFAHSTQVTLSLQYADNVGVTSMMVSNNQNFSQASWETPKNSKAWTLPAPDGEKTVYTKYKDGAGNQSDVCSDSITLITQKNISRLSGYSRYETAVEISKKSWNTSDEVILTRGDLFPDALSGAPFAAKYNAPILLSNPEFLTKSTADEIKRLGAKRIKILGSENAIFPKVVDDLKNQCSISSSNISRIGGSTRYETSAEIAKWLLPPSNKTAIIAYGENYPDALASASAAAYKGMPILLVKKDTIPSAIQEVLKTLKIEKAIIVGGSDVVSETVEGWLKDNGYDPIRLGGDTRYDTCYLIADYILKNMGMNLCYLGIAYGENFPDALTLGPLAGKLKASVLLVRGTFIPDNIRKLITTHKNEIYQVYIAGGADVVADGVKDEIWGIIK